MRFVSITERILKHSNAWQLFFIKGGRQ